MGERRNGYVKKKGVLSAGASKTPWGKATSQYVQSYLQKSRHWELFIFGLSTYQVLCNQSVLLWLTTSCLRGLSLAIEHGTRSHVYICICQQSCQWRILVDHQQWLVQGGWGHGKGKDCHRFLKRVNFQSVENREHICMARKVKGNCGMFLISILNDKWSIKMGHELSHAVWVSSFKFMMLMCCR